MLAEREAERAEREVRATTWGVARLHWEILAQLLAPPPHRRESTPVSMSTVVLLFVLMLSVKPSDGLRAGFVDLSSFMPEMWLLSFVLTFFLQVLETSPCRGGAVEIFNFSLHLRFLSCVDGKIPST
jgi:hypothetical protein